MGTTRFGIGCALVKWKTKKTPLNCVELLATQKEYKDAYIAVY